MFCAYTRPRYQVSVYRTIGPLVLTSFQKLFCQSKPKCYVEPPLEVGGGVA